jgi:hypothetical protein
LHWITSRTSGAPELAVAVEVVKEAKKNLPGIMNVATSRRVVVVIVVVVVNVPGTKILCRAQKPYTSPIKRGIS